MKQVFKRSFFYFICLLILLSVGFYLFCNLNGMALLSYIPQGMLPFSVITSFDQIKIPEKTVHTYPISIYPEISEIQTTARESAFINKNGSNWYFNTMDAGYNGDVKSDAIKFNAAPQSYELSTFTEEEKQQWIHFLRSNAEFFGISFPEDLQLQEDTTPGDYYDPTINTTPNRKILVARQLIPIDLNSNVMAEIGKIQIKKYPQSQVEILGHFWPYPQLPKISTIPQKQIEGAVLGKIFRYKEPQVSTMPCIHCINPQSQASITHTIIFTKDNFHITKTIILLPRYAPYGQIQRSELRLVYKIFFDLPNKSLSDESKTLLIDAITGENLNKIQDAEKPTNQLHG